MRPEILFPLFAKSRTLPGIGPKLAALVEKVCGPHVVDLLWHLPQSLVDRSQRPLIREAPDGAIVTLKVNVDRHQKPENPRRPWRVLVSDEFGFGTLIFFHARADWIEKQLPEGSERIVSGKIEHFRDGVQMAHPDYIVPPDRADEIPALEPVYPLTAGLAPKILLKAVHGALERAPELPEWQNAEFHRRKGWTSWRDAIGQLHAPKSVEEITLLHPARQRLAYDELLANQLALALVRASFRRQVGRPVKGDGKLRRKILAAIPFKLTGAQTRSLAEITADMEQPLRMSRLLQGDVGSGKTVVALLAMAAAVETGTQAALMAPTEILARQHMATIDPIAISAGLRVALLTGRDKGKARGEILAALAAGEIDILIGTHALFQDEVEFKDLALAVIDEQHRFGVHQRLELAAKGRAVDMLVMTATPIPRTLMLTAYGDMDVSRLDEKPPGRRKIDTRVLKSDRLSEVVEGLKRAVAQGAKAYWVCPLIDEFEKIDLAAAEERHLALSEVFGKRVGLVHGRMKGPARDKVMEEFAGTGLDVLVATTVIEVGVDVPEATVMVIEHAERFGLAQLHQLRGRIGRSDKPSSCLLLYAGALGETARQRLNILKETEDGFRIAEEDLRLRGAGEMLGKRQSGLPEFRLADLAVHGELLAAAQDDAKLILSTDAELQSPRGQALRTLLYLFEQDAQVKTLRSG